VSWGKSASAHGETGGRAGRTLNDVGHGGNCHPVGALADLQKMAGGARAFEAGGMHGQGREGAMEGRASGAGSRGRTLLPMLLL